MEGWIEQDVVILVIIMVTSIWLDAIITYLLAKKLKKGGDVKWAERVNSLTLNNLTLKILTQRLGPKGALIGIVPNTLLVTAVAVGLASLYGNILYKAFIYGITTGMFITSIILNFRQYMKPVKKEEEEEAKPPAGSQSASKASVKNLFKI